MISRKIYKPPDVPVPGGVVSKTIFIQIQISLVRNAKYLIVLDKNIHSQLLY
jgi:hypothetical protein